MGINNGDYYATGMVSIIRNDPETLSYAARNCLSLNASQNSYKKYKKYSKLTNRSVHNVPMLFYKKSPEQDFISMILVVVWQPELREPQLYFNEQKLYFSQLLLYNFSNFC